MTFKRFVYGGMTLVVAMFLIMLPFEEYVDVDDYLSRFDAEDDYVLKKYSKEIQRGQLSGFLACLKRYKGMHKRKISNHSSPVYQDGTYMLVMPDGTIINLAVAGGKADTFDVQLSESAITVAAGPKAIECNLGLLSKAG